ncbi:MAG: alpha/beta fold hydrolase [Victivallaceae bacterium]|nr:alpha/beta fold hydrolase [Victivallaceae bacterium]
MFRPYPETNCICGYFTHRVYRPIYSPAPGVPDRKELVVLVHGLTHRSWVMFGMGKFLARHGYLVNVYDYPTTRGRVPEHGEDLANHIDNLMRRNAQHKLNLVAHSMGGLLSRVALDRLELSENRRGRAVFLGVPNYGSNVAHLVLRIPGIARLIQTLPDLDDAPDGTVRDFPLPQKLPVGSISAASDLLVPRASTYLPNEIDHRILPGHHTLMMFHTSVREATLRFLETGKF